MRSAPVLLVALFTANTARGKEARPLVGAIRWDAWTGGGVTEQVERTLGPAKYHNRLPWFARVLGPSNVKIDGSPQVVMDAEIDMASRAGIDYWAFLIYHEQYRMSDALKQYLRSRKRSKVRFCMILANTLSASTEDWPSERDRAVALMKRPEYVRVAGSRPLVYVFAGGGIPFNRFKDFHDAAVRQRLNPYCVYMGWNPEADWPKVKSKEFDAVSAYAYGSDQAKFADLAKSVETYYWGRAVKAKAPYVPLVTTGWDKNPRKDSPVSWEKKGQKYHTQKVFPSRATPEEIVDHLSNALDFIDKHADLCKARAVIVYAWNEYDEGGWIAPTRDKKGRPDNSRLAAIGGLLNKR
jgi:hypothetical protein